MLSNLPDITDDFVGRENELAFLADVLKRHRLVTLTGAGGVGKSRLALHAAAAVLKDEGRSVIWADLWPLRDDRRLTATVADAAGFADHTALMPLDALCGWLADKDAVLVLDSCEHLRAACRHLAAHLIMTCPSLTVLATSREALEVPGECLHAVEPLPVATDALDLLTRRAATAGTTLTAPADRIAAEHLCAWLEGIPLALELVAGQLGTRTITEIERTLRSRLQVEAGPRVPGPPRHRAIRTTVGWSHELCGPAERLLWARLSVFRGTVDADTVRAICGAAPLRGRDVDTVLAGLVAKSVLTHGADGYRMLDTVREYGAMWLAEIGEAADLADRHATHFLDLAREADGAWFGPHQAAWYRRIDDAHPDLCAALDHFLATRPEAAVEMSGLIGFFWNCCGHLREAAEYTEAALTLCGERGPTRTRAEWSLGMARVLRGEHEAASALAASCQQEALSQADTEGILRATYLKGVIHLLYGRPMTARWLVDGELRLAGDEARLTAGRVMCRLVRVFALTAEGRLDRARHEAEELHADCAARGEWWTRSYAAYQLALIALFEDRTRDAAEHAVRSLRGKHRLGDSYGIALGLDLLASVLAAQGVGERAVTAYGAGETYWGAVGHPLRGTPELAHVREQFQRSARGLLGDDRYDEVLHRSTREHPESLLRDLIARVGS
ncbi:ATP-binding protein [Streptomyces sp. NPDC058417]|uniref:ATP-binding protein n=1 Tax=unclassified Streptomyces TaxID=2593676 RepID=UPI0036500876